MLQALEEHGYRFDHAVGTSLGAVNAAAHAAGTSGDEILHFWDWMYEEVLDSPLRAIARGITTRQARRQQDQVRERLAGLMPGDFDGLHIPLTLVGTDLRTGAEVLMDSGDLIEAVLASAAVPGVLPPVEVGGRPLIDGGLVAGMPLRAVPPRVRSLVVLDAGHSAVDAGTAAELRWWEVGALSYAHLIRGQAAHALQTAARRMQVVLLSTSVGGLLEFTDPRAYAEAGRDAASSHLTRLPARLRRGIYGLPSGLDEFETLEGLAVRP
jgi:NTE family protein